MAIIFEIEHTTTEAPSHPHVRSVKFKLNLSLFNKKGPRSSKRVPPSGNNRRVELSGRDRSAVQVKCQLNE
jgi:hypothetical protein